MTLPSSGSITFEMLNTELRRTPSAFLTLNDPALREMAGVPSGPISISDLYGKSYAFESIISSTTTNLTLSSLFSVDEWTSSTPKRVIINSGVEVGSTNISNAAISVGIGLGGSLTLINNGTISGAGGTPSNKTGGTAINCNSSIFITNNGTIRAGGGAGGKGGTGGNGIYVSAREPSSGFYYSNSSPPYTLWKTNLGIYWNTSSPIYGAMGDGPTQITTGGWTYLKGAQTGSDNRNFSIARQQTSTSFGGSGGNGGRGQGYDGSASSGSGGAAGGPNAGTGGQGGSGASWGSNGTSGSTGNAGNNGSGLGGESGGLGGIAITGYNPSLHINNGTILGRL